MAAAALLCGTAPAAASSHSRSCELLDRPSRDRVVLRPKAETFYSVDVLNPDLVRRGNRWLLFFSGNSAQHDAGEWRTGLATSHSVSGRFRVRRSALGSFFNGGTVLTGGRFLHGANLEGRIEPVLFSGRRPAAWREVSPMPFPEEWNWRRWQSDLYLDPRRDRLDIYFAGRPGPGGADLGLAHFDQGHWWGFRQVLAREEGRWDQLDLGEPAVFRAGGNTYMLYGGLRMTGEPRHIGLAVKQGGRFTPCGNRPLIAAHRPWASQNAIDPEPVVAGKRLHVFYGGGRRPSLGGDMHGVILHRSYRLRR